MTPRQFDQRLLEERHRFLTLCGQERVFLEVERIIPALAVEFAEGLILDFSEAQARARIQATKPGAAAFAMLTASLVGDRRARPALAARMPERDLAPFYVLCALVLDAAAERDRGSLPPGDREG